MSEVRAVEDDRPGAGTTPPLPAADLGPRGLAVGVVAATVAALVLHLVASARVGAPTVVFDETGYLGNARWLAGAGAGWEMPTAPRYALGYPLVIAPVTRAFTSAGAQWRAVMVVNAVLLASVVPLLVLVARRVLGAGRGAALLAAGIGAVAPAVVAAGSSAIAEDLVLPLVPASVLALHAARRTGPAAYLFGPAVALLYATHPRFTGALVVGLVVLAVGARTRVVAPRVAAGNAVLLGAGSATAWLATRAVERARWTHVERLEGGATELRELVTSPSGLGEVAATAVGQAWYLAAGSLGLAVVGGAGLVLALRRRAASDARPAGGPGLQAGIGAAAPVDRLALAWLLALAGAVFATSVAFFAQNQFRADHLVYGRHNDSFTPLWLMAGVLVVVAADRRRLLRLGALAAAVVGGLAAVLLLVRDAGAYDGQYSAFAVPAVIRYVGDDPAGTFWRATLAGLVGLVVVLGVAAVARRPLLLAPVLVAWAVWAGFGTVSATTSFEDTIYEGWDVPADVRRLEPEAVSIDVRAVDGAFPALSWPWALPDVAFTTYDPAFGEGPDAPFVLTRSDDAGLAAEGARLALVDQSGYTTFWGAEAGVGLWVRPGPDQDRLAEDGLLLPAGFPTGLPEAARSADVALVRGEAGTKVEVAPGGTVEVGVRVRHTGGGSPWPGRGAYGGPAGVRIVATVDPLDPGDPVGARSGGDVPGWVVPGEAFTAPASVVAVDARLQPLAPGRYRVGLGVGQDDPGWVTAPGPDATFTLVVTEG
ncbi:hypothetical protein PO878_07505 [Iamia majanohamensis]|uniref:4-amino-4-deoxy-L-arabinose transferase-like glycosyltransferase n=1 Tax=Iamia majanohamensis TaxID=467976 RepID=A0AAF0BWZ9_9ACTN|nr:hypothetical protein [Iamia majanohamensis]WCO68573.1 hypothetical protein PO878_07505 [Iamia majanohamensis]